MPIYEYECEKCGRIQEAWQKISDAPLTRCEQCRGKLHKIISQSSFHLKGSGWYATDYAGKSGSSGANSPQAETPKKCDKSQSPKTETAKAKTDSNK